MRDNDHGYASGIGGPSSSLRLAGEEVLAPAPAPPAVPLSRRERQCLTLIARGLRIGEVADAAGLARSTVESHLAQARRKLGARTLAHAAAIIVAIST